MTTVQITVTLSIKTNPDAPLRINSSGSVGFYGENAVAEVKQGDETVTCMIVPMPQDDGIGGFWVTPMLEPKKAPTVSELLDAKRKQKASKPKSGDEEIADALG